MSRFLKCDGLCTFFIIEGYQNLIIIQVNRIDERIHQCLPLVFQAHIELAKPEKPEADELFRHFRLRQLFFRNAGFKLTLGFFELLQSFLGGTGEDSGLNRIEHILDTRFRIPELLLIEGKIGVLPVLQFHNLGDDGFHGGIIPDKLHGLVDHQIFQPLFADGLFLAALVLFGGGAFIIAVNFARPARAALTKHQRPAVTAVQLGGQKVIILCLSPGRGFLVFQHLLLHIVEKFQRHDGRNCIWHDHVPEFQFSDVPPILEHVFDTVISKRTAHRIFDTIFIQPVPNLFHCKTIPVLPERFQHKRRGERVNMELPLGIQRIAKCATTTVAAAFQDVLGLSTHDLLGKVSGIILGITFQHRFQNNALRPLGDDLGGRHELDAVLLQLGLIPGTVVAVPGKTVQLPDQHNIKQLLVTVLNHLLELRAVVRLGEDSTVNIVLDDGDAVFLGISRAFPDLAFDGFFALVVRGIASIDHGGHGGHLHFIRH